jgi:hypothetical protein
VSFVLNVRRSTLKMRDPAEAGSPVVRGTPVGADEEEATASGCAAAAGQCEKREHCRDDEELLTSRWGHGRLKCKRAARSPLNFS